MENPNEYSFINQTVEATRRITIASEILPYTVNQIGRGIIAPSHVISRYWSAITSDAMESARAGTIMNSIKLVNTFVLFVILKYKFLQNS
jgi:hypothetical protein